MSKLALFVVLWLTSVSVFAVPHDVVSVLKQAQQEYQQGRYWLALDTLSQVDEQQAEIQGLKGLIHYCMRHFEPAETLLNTALKNSHEPKSAVPWLIALAEIHAQRGLIDEAQTLYHQALLLTDDNSALNLSIQLGQLTLLLASEQWSALTQLQPKLLALPQSVERSRLLLNVATQAQHLGEQGLKLAYESYQQVLADSGTQQEGLKAASLDGLAQLYENQQRYQEAYRLNQDGLAAALNAQDEPLLIMLEWRHGRLAKHLQQRAESISAYQNAIQHIAAIRRDIPVEYHNGRSSFRELLEPVYLGLADLLLQQARESQSGQKTELLKQARETVELIKLAELEDYLGGRCGVQSRQAELDQVLTTTTAVLYPIVLPERLELLVGNGVALEHVSVNVSAAELQQHSQRFAKSLRKGSDASLALAQQLHRWLIAPINPWLKQNHINTLVLVPDGMLRLIPPAALHDGQHYLIESYAVSVSQGLSLSLAPSLQSHEFKALLAGMSKPGRVIENLPATMLKALSASSERGRGSAQSRALPIDEVNTRSLDVDRDLNLQRLMNTPAFRQKLTEQLSLPGVDEEIKQLSQQMPNTTLKNESFTVEEFKQHALTEPYSVVHIASHGVFGKTAETSFVMAYDNLININELESLLKNYKFQQQPISLITLSACQTAEGDDRAPLGLIGIALKANVGSALGSLWPVSDEAASLLMAEFYRGLTQPGISKAEALRQAQIKLLKRADLANPFYWSPFILAGNWL